MSSLAPLPPASGYVEVVLLDGGGFTTADDTRLHQGGHERPFYLYDWCFYIHHRPSGQEVLWDLGLSGDNADYTPFVVNNHFRFCNPTGPRLSLQEQLKALDVQATDITTIIFSHAHWDHCRPASAKFPNAKIYFGPGTSQHCSPGHIFNGQVLPSVEWDSRYFGDDEVKTESFEELAGPWTPWGPFDLAMDFFRDGSFMVVQAPGHMPGNLAACVRLQSGERIMLSSDCCHSIGQKIRFALGVWVLVANYETIIECRDILLGRRDMAILPLPDGSTFCLHADIPAARETIRKLKECKERFGMHIAMTHDCEWIQLRENNVLMSMLPAYFDDDCLDRIRDGRQP